MADAPAVFWGKGRVRGKGQQRITRMPKIELPKAYDFHAVERKLYEWWEKSGYFQPVIDHTRKPFVISIPPPNVTGELHLGHAMFVSIEDLMIRYHRMLGDPTLWVPGSDHAGIATQLQVEKMLLREDEVTREEMGREKFVERTWEWKRKYGGIIYDQLRRLGASCDWTRERFTLDDGLGRAVREAFVRLHEKGLLYRGPRLVNWSPGLRTAVSDLEVEYSDEPGTLYYFKYPHQGIGRIHPRRHHPPGDDPRRYRRRRASGGSALRQIRRPHRARPDPRPRDPGDR